MPPVPLKNYIPFQRPVSSKVFGDVALTLKGRDAIACALNYWKIGRDDTVLLPGYICDAVIAAFVGICNVVYYDIEPDYSICTKTLETTIASGKIKVLYIIHYFGFLHRNIEALRRICTKYGVHLWEDHAHSALSRVDFTRADAAFFSFRKILPVAEGGGVWIRGTTNDDLVCHPNVISDIISILTYSKRRLWGSSKLLRRIADWLACRQVDHLKSGVERIVVRPISHTSSKIIRSVDIESIVSERRHLFLCWLDRIVHTQFQPVFRNTPAEVCPQGFPIWIANPDEVVHCLEKEKVFLKVHWPLPEYLKTICPVSWRMSKSIVTLPIYPGISQDNIDEIVRLVVRFGKPKRNPS